MKRTISLTTLIIFICGVAFSAAFLGVRRAEAQINIFTFFIPYSADELDDQFDVGNNNNVFINRDITTTISIAVQRDNTLIYYDNWEDGLELNLTAPPPQNLQPNGSTQIWGDNNPTNGIPPNFATDTLNAGTVIVLQNTIDIPRDQSDFFFDGGDKLTSVGGSIAVTRAAWPDAADILFAGAWELYPTSRWGTEYRIPIGEDLASGNPLNQRSGFEVVGLNVQAALDNTRVEIDLGNDGVVEYPNLILKEGEQFTLLGQEIGIDPLQSVLVGSRISSLNGQPIQVHVFAANPRENYEARAYTIVPFDQWTGDYLAPRSSDGDYWLYNPNPVQLPVTVRTASQPPVVINIPTRSTLRYSNGVTMSTATGMRFSAPNDFYGIVALDADSAQDWGYALLPVENLTTQELIGWGPGNNLKPPGPGPSQTTGLESQVYVTALVTTTVFVTYSNGLTASFPITPLVETPITSPNFDMTGAFLYSSNDTPFVSAWGQDQSARPDLPSIDVGTSIIPLPTLALQKFFDMVEDEGDGHPFTWGDTIRFTLVAYNNSVNPVTNGIISDTLPIASVTYVPESSTVGGAPISDTVGLTPYPFDEGGVSVGTIPAVTAITATFDAIIKDDVDVIVNNALASSDQTGLTDPGGVTIPVLVPRFELDKRIVDPANGQTDRGRVITYGLTLTNTGNMTLTTLPLRDQFDEDHLTFLSASPFMPDLTNSGLITWTNLATTTRFGPFRPKTTIHLTTTYLVDDIPPMISRTINIATVEGAQASDGTPLLPQSDDEAIVVPLIASFELDKRLIDPANGVAVVGQVITFGISISSTGTLPITVLPLQDDYNEDHFTFLRALPFPPTLTDAGLVFWDNLASPERFGPLTPGRTVQLTLTFRVDVLPPNVVQTINIATVEGAQGGDGAPLPPDLDDEQVNFPAPAPSDLLPPDNNDDRSANDDDDGDPPPARSAPPADSEPQPTPLAPLPVEPGPTPTRLLPVNFLPETGVAPPFVRLIWPLLIVSALSLLILRLTSKDES